MSTHTNIDGFTIISDPEIKFTSQLERKWSRLLRVLDKLPENDWILLPELSWADETSLRSVIKHYRSYRVSVRNWDGSQKIVGKTPTSSGSYRYNMWMRNPVPLENK